MYYTVHTSDIGDGDKSGEGLKKEIRTLSNVVKYERRGSDLVGIHYQKNTRGDCGGGGGGNG